MIEYKIYVDDNLVYHPHFTDLKVTDAEIEYEQNSFTTFTFTVPKDNPRINYIYKRKSSVKVYKNNRLIFNGIVCEDYINFYGSKTVRCKDISYFLTYSSLRSYDFTGSPEEFLKFIIEKHNEQVIEKHRFKVGTVTVTDANDYITRSDSEGGSSAWSLILGKLVDLLGGYIRIRTETDGFYIDYLTEFDTTNVQEVELGKNMLDYICEGDASDIFTVLIPYGAEVEVPSEVEGEPAEIKRIDITSVNSGVDFITHTDGVNQYGKITKILVWDDVTEPSNLLRKARQVLNDSVLQVNNFEIQAVDLEGTSFDVESFQMGSYIKIKSDFHNINELYLPLKFTDTLFDPKGKTITLNKKVKAISDFQLEYETSIKNQIDVVKREVGEKTTINVDVAKNETITLMNTLIEDSEETTRNMMKEYVSESDFEQYKETVSTDFSQTAEDFTFKFNSVNDRITTENGEINRQLEEVSKYIRFVDGNIILGEVGNALTTKIANGRISFIHNETTEVAYISENKLYITNTEVLNQIVIGKFAFIPRENGNLTFKKL